MKKVKVTDRWDIILPDHRADRFNDMGDSLWPIWEKDRLIDMHRVVKPGFQILDIGTEEGDISGLLAMWAGQDGNVCLFEPNPRVWPNIKAIWEANDLPLPKDYFVGFAANIDEFNPPNLNIDATERDGWPECAYGPLIGDHGFRHLAEESDATPCIKIDTFCERKDIRPDMITMDIEGAEWEALKGAEKVLEKYRPIVFVSVHPEFMNNMFGYSAKDMFDWMDEHKYDRTLLAIDHEHHYRFDPR